MIKSMKRLLSVSAAVALGGAMIAAGAADEKKAQVGKPAPDFTLTNAWCEPKPVQAKLPLVIGGKGPKRTLRTAARWADQWDMTFPESPAAWTLLDGVLYVDRLADPRLLVFDQEFNRYVAPAMAPTETVPACPALSASISAPASARLDRAMRPWRIMLSPYQVARIPRGRRSNRDTPISSSRSLSSLEAAGCDMFSDSAARWMLPCSSIAISSIS